MFDMKVPGELICEGGQIHKRPAEDISPSGTHPVGWRLDTGFYALLLGLSFFGSFFDSRILWRSTRNVAAFLTTSLNDSSNFPVCLALRYVSRSITVIGPVWWLPSRIFRVLLVKGA